jgi:His-Xaa-Ser system radical SAM maturase HxsB
MTTMKKTEKNTWAVLPYNIERFKDRYLVSNLFGSWDILERDEFTRLEGRGLQEQSPLFKRLYKSGIIADENSLKNLIEDYRNLHGHLFTDTSLHIAVVTTRCNMNCLYCQTKTNAPQDMTIEVASRILKYVFDTQNPYANIEFQGGEPLLNWEIIKFITENASRINTGNKHLAISLVTNGTLLDDKKIEYLAKHNVGICFSFDGPSTVHNANRVMASGNDAYDTVKDAITRTKQIYKQQGLPHSVNLLCTITRKSLQEPEKIVDEYIALGADKIPLRPLSKLGLARDQWDAIGYTAEEFIAFWTRAMDHILELNKQGKKIQERLSVVILSKIFKKVNPGYVDMMSPCGAGRAVLAYMPNGDIYPCDEARMIGETMFKLGNVVKDDYQAVMKSNNVFCLCESSLMDLWDYNTAFLPWLGTCPVLNYAQDKSLVPKIKTSNLHKIFTFQIRYIFDRIIQDDKNKEIFLSWLT